MATIPAFYFDSAVLNALAAKHHAEFRESDPFPHVVLDDFLPGPIVELLIGEFPGDDDIAWRYWGSGDPIDRILKSPYSKRGTCREEHLGSFTRHFVHELHSATFLEFLSDLTGTNGLVPDPALSDCGLHSTGRGGKLLIHTDSSRHPNARFHQSLNLILFLNPTWKEEYGGHLELWDRRGLTCVKKVAPIANRCVIFETDETSFHGHPEPLECPATIRRNSIAVYYYELDRTADRFYSGLKRRVTWRFPQQRSWLGHVSATALKRIFSSLQR